MLTTTEQERIRKTAIEQAQADRIARANAPDDEQDPEPDDCGGIDMPTDATTPTTWIVVDRATGQAIRELFEWANVARVDRVRYDVLTALEWLQRVNREIKAGIR